MAPHNDGSDWLTFGVHMFIPSVLCGSTEFTYHMIKSNFGPKNQQTTKLDIRRIKLGQLDIEPLVAQGEITPFFQGG